MAAVSPESVSDNPIDFRAPPPSPIATGRRSCVTNDDVLTEFLEHSLRVPDLILPDRIFPRKRSVQTPPAIDFQSMTSPDNDAASRILESIASIGCFQVVNHGICRDLIRSASSAAAGIFRVSPEKKAAASRSPENPFGFDEMHCEEDTEMMSEEFVWCRDESLRLEMEGMWPVGYSNFCDKMECLTSEIEKMTQRILRVLHESYVGKSSHGKNSIEGEELMGSICYLHKHRQSIAAEVWMSSLRYDVIRMLIRGSDFSHALCVHACDGSSEFHVYSKKGWVSFCPDDGALVITVGDQIQAWSGGKYKHVIGRPIYKGNEEDCISMAFLCSPPTITNTSHKEKDKDKDKTISLAQQAILALFLILVYHSFVFIYKTL